MVRKGRDLPVSMKSPRNQFILLGIVCQGLTWDGYLVPAVSMGLWMLGVALAKMTSRIPLALEPVALAGGCLAGYWLGTLPGQNSHFFIGHGITCLQVLRVARPLTDREKLFSMIAACVQLGV